MQQVKIFKGVETDLQVLEGEVNQWLIKTGVRVVNLFGNIAPQTMEITDSRSRLGRSAFGASDILIVVVYEKPGKPQAAAPPTG